MPRLVSLQARRFKRWLLRFKGDKSRDQTAVVEWAPPERVPAPAPLRSSVSISRGERAIESEAGPALCDDGAPVIVAQRADRADERTRLSINALPKEIFIRILSYDDETNEGPTLPLLASWTCSSWRQIVLHAPTLWSTIRLCSYNTGLPEVLLRSGNCGIDFILDSISAASITFPRDVSALLAILQPHFCRIASLNLVLPDHDCVEAALVELCGVVPNLQSLELSLPYDACSGMQSFASALSPDIANSFGVVGCGSAEKLQVLKLRAVTFPWYDVAFSHLTTLCMASMCTDDTTIIWDQLADTLLRNNSTLEELVLDQCEFRVEDESQSYPIIALPKLKYLHLRLVEPALIAKLLSNVAMPSLETLELEFDAEDQCEVFRALFPCKSVCPEKEPVKSLGRVRNLTIQGGAYPADLFCDVISRMPDLERLMLGGCTVTKAIILALSLPRMARKLTDMWLELCKDYCASDLQQLARARCGGVRVHEIKPAGQAVPVT